MEKVIKVLVVDDHLVVRKGYEYMIKVYPDMKLIGEASSGEQAISLCQKLEPDVVLIDIKLPQLSGISTIRTIKEQYPNIQLVAITSYIQEKELVIEALEAGAISFLYKNASIDDLANGIRSAYKGRSYFSPEATQSLIESKLSQSSDDFNLTTREMEVLRLLANGLTNIEIAEVLVVSHATIKFHVSSILKKLGATTRTEAVAIAIRHKLIDN